MLIVIWTIIIGFVVGLAARSLLPGRDEAGVLVTTGLGISGALLGSIFGRALGMYGPRDPVSLIMSILGAVMALTIYRRYFTSTRTSTR
jgi:uncharacterized membrane protein YeaQ/YmgE (transglycosylase-associated protein family)